jgi:chromate transporter
VVLTQGAVTDLTTAAIALATLAVLLRYKVKEPYVVLACAALGIALH